jgi:branched-chain amino acid transport system ATP-binding protein
LNTLAGIVKKTKGSITFCGEKTPTAVHKVVSSGIVLVPEGRRIFGSLTVKENLMMGAYLRKMSKSVENDLDYVLTVFPRMKERLKQQANTLSGGEQQMLAIGRGIMSKPRLLMLDEPSLGLAPVLVKEIFKQIVEINKTGVTILMVEQNANQALKLATHAYVLQTGSITLYGTGEEVLKNPEVQEAYLGRGRRNSRKQEIEQGKV